MLSSDSKYEIGYVSDIEGSLEAWYGYLRTSKVLTYNPLHTPAVTLNDNCFFVYGGDICDRGSGDIHLLRDLISLKERYPTKVFFILGNRDVNKLRLPFSLHPKVLAHPANVYWVSGQGEDEGKVLNDRVARLKWVSRVAANCIPCMIAMKLSSIRILVSIFKSAEQLPMQRSIIHFTPLYGRS
ncbi:hypothetical protein EON65_15035 [archaeon]|nr:MAG: hypothetical protein EON65_15035 [archaeon]